MEHLAHRPCPDFRRRAAVGAISTMLAVLALTDPCLAGAIIAIAGPSSGREATTTSAIADAARSAIGTLNAQGGINGEQLSVEIFDDGCDATKAAETAGTIASRKAVLVLGHPCSAAAIAAAKVYAAQSTVFIATATRHPALTSPRSGPTIFRFSGRDDKQGEDAARYLAETFKGQTIAIVHDRTKFARTVAESAAATLTKFAGPAPITATLIAAEKDFPAVTAKIKPAAAVFYAGFPLEAGMLFQQLRASGSKAAFLMSDSNATREFEATFATAATGVSVMLARTAIAGGATGPDSDVRKRAEIRALTQAAVDAFAFAASAAKTNDGKKIADHLATNGATITASRGPTPPAGSIPFEASGDLRRPSFDPHTWTGAIWQRAQYSPQIR